jgi:hypothetical protein
MGTMAPLDGEDFASHPVVLIIGHVADHSSSAQQEQCRGEEKEEPCRGVGEGAGATVALGGEASRCAPPRFLVAVRRFLQRGRRSFHQKRWTTNKQQSKVDEGWLLTRGSQCRAPTTPPPPKDTICHWDWGEGVAGFNMAQKGRAGDAIIMRWTIK